MKTSQKGLNLITEFEGLELAPYSDAVGVPTIGYGSTRYENGTKVTMRDKPITKDRAIELFKNTLVTYENAVNRNVKVTLNQNQYDALVSFTYNLGEANLKSSTLLRLLNQGDYKGAANQFPRWNKAKGKVLAGLTRRRAAEKQLFESKL
ncbi:lysozyme [Neisseria sp. Ec49-e6-T10]|uniref:lysozyme n=1 Tax=Neisseria sp. Ec49-e6-T10 TaxID=3140744 RepID=UPI003EBB3F2A